MGTLSITRDPGADQTLDPGEERVGGGDVPKGADRGAVHGEVVGRVQVASAGHGGGVRHRVGRRPADATVPTFSTTSV